MVQKDPTPATFVALGQAYTLNKEPDKALPLFEKAVSGDPENYDFRMLYGRGLRSQKKYNPATGQFFAATPKAARFQKRRGTS